MKIVRIIMGAAAVCAIIVAGSATAQDQYGRDRSNRYNDRYHDRYGSFSTTQFVEKAARGGMAEVAFSNLARQRASDRDVRVFAGRMVRDHSQANRQLERLARRKGMSVPTDMDVSQRMALRRLRYRHGESFDRQYMQEMVRDHDSTVAMFRDYARNGDDPDLRAWARETLPTLDHHRSMAEETQDAVNAGYGDRWHR